MKVLGKNLTVILLAFTLSGCCQALLNLKKLGENQEETKVYVKNQEGLFAKLSDDLKNNRLEAGNSMDEVISLYGQPIERKDMDYKGKPAHAFIYRHPVKFFNTDLIYLYFDQAGHLYGWDTQPAG